MLPVDHFYRAVATYPDRIAVKDGDVEITYAELGGNCRCVGRRIAGY